MNTWSIKKSNNKKVKKKKSFKKKEKKGASGARRLGRPALVALPVRRPCSLLLYASCQILDNSENIENNHVNSIMII